MVPRPPRRTLMQLWKQGWNEIPEVMGSSLYALAGVIGIPIAYAYYIRNDSSNRRFKHQFLIYRPEDHRVERIKKFPDSPVPTWYNSRC